MKTLKEFRGKNEVDPIKAMRGGKDFAIISAWRAGNSIAKNISLNDDLLKQIQRLGGESSPKLIIGYWQESPDPNKNWSEYDKDELTSVQEESFFVVKPDGITQEYFMGFLKDMMSIFKQDAVLYGHGTKGHILERSSNYSIGSLKVGKVDYISSVAQGYSVIPGTNKAFTFN